MVHNMLLDLIERFAAYGVIHSDFNEFNIMVDNKKKIWVIDFPQMVSTAHKNARFFFERDVKCVNDFFARRFAYFGDRKCTLEGVKKVTDLDVQIKAAGYEAEKTLDVGDTKALVRSSGGVLSGKRRTRGAGGVGGGAGRG